MSELLIRGHLGLGDALICNAIVRHYAALHSQTVILCKPHNIPTLNFLWRDIPSIETFSVTDDKEADEAAKSAQGAGFQILGLGASAFHAFGSKDFDLTKWDREFYRQADLPFQDRWAQFICTREPAREIRPPKTPYVLIHEDPKRDCLISKRHLPVSVKHVWIDPSISTNLFDWWGMIENATELHFMESSPAILADSLPTIHARRKVIHHYCRKSTAPAYRMDWAHIWER